jgi:hypothetical protein
MAEELYEYEILNNLGTPFLRSARPKTIDEINADPTLQHALKHYPHRARIVGSGELEHLPGFPQRTTAMT